MAAPLAVRVGRGPCPLCAETITFKRSAGGKLTWRCDVCDVSGFAEPTGPGEDRLLKTITGFKKADPTPPEPAPIIRDESRKTPEPPKIKKQAFGFDLSQLGSPS